MESSWETGGVWDLLGVVRGNSFAVGVTEEERA